MDNKMKNRQYKSVNDFAKDIETILLNGSLSSSEVTDSGFLLQEKYLKMKTKVKYPHFVKGKPLSDDSGERKKQALTFLIKKSKNWKLATANVHNTLKLLANKLSDESFTFQKFEDEFLSVVNTMYFTPSITSSATQLLDDYELIFGHIFKGQPHSQASHTAPVLEYLQLDAKVIGRKQEMDDDEIDNVFLQEMLDDNSKEISLFGSIDDEPEPLQEINHEWIEDMTNVQNIRVCGRCETGVRISHFCRKSLCLLSKSRSRFEQRR